MSRAGIAVSVHPGPLASVPTQAVVVDAGVALPVAYGGLRKILESLRAVAPGAVQRAAHRNPAAWNRLFPGEVPGAPDLADLALTPSERRLHRESEQTFWILNLAARAILDALAESGRPLVVRNAGECDLVSLRGLMRAVEWARIEGLSGHLLLSDFSRRRRHASTLFARRYGEHMGTLRERMRGALEPGAGMGPVSDRALEAPVDPEGRYFHEVVDEGSSAERRVAAAILAVRACFFSTNYEGAMLAAEHGLSLLDRAGAGFSRSALEQAWDALDEQGFVTPAIEVDKGSLGDVEELRALLHRQIGVVHVYTGEHDGALESFARGLECKISPERRAQLRMFRALTLIKRIGNLPKARAEIEDGLAGLSGREGQERLLHEGWLRNVYALTYFQEKALEPALHQEKLAMKCVGELHDPSATHLKINLISNISVLQETAKKFVESITTWRRYEKISANWGANFFKHHAYRLAGLELMAGDRTAAVTDYGRAYASAESLGDSYHRQSIAAELGRLHLDDGNRGEALVWYRRAAEGAREIGDPLRLAESLAGEALCGEGDFAEPLRLAGESTTYPTEAHKLTAALQKGEAAGIQAALPKPRTKLNRPFDLVNL